MSLADFCGFHPDHVPNWASPEGAGGGCSAHQEHNKAPPPGGGRGRLPPVHGRETQTHATCVFLTVRYAYSDTFSFDSS